MSKQAWRAQFATVLTAFTLLFSIFAFMTMNGSVAWFSSSKEVEASGMSITLQDPESIVKEITYYAIGESGGVRFVDATTNEYTFSALSADQTLGAFTPIGSGHQVLIKLTLKEDAGPFALYASTRAAGYPTADGSSGETLGDENNSFSSVVQFYTVGASQTDGEGNALVKEENGSVILTADDPTNNKSFVSLAEGETQPRFSADDILLYTADAGESAIYIILDYHTASANYLSDQANQAENITGGDDRTIDFDKCDFVFLIG